MTRQEPTLETIDADAAREQWDAILDRVGRCESRFLLERDGKPVAAVVSAHDLEMYQHYVRRREERFKIVDALQERFQDVPSDEIQREIERAIAEVRADRRAAAVATPAAS